MDKIQFPAGLGTALITPFCPDGAVDYTALDRLLDKQLASAVDYLVVLGTSGEAATLTAAENKEVRQHIVKYVGGQKPLVLGVGGNNTAVVAQQLKSLGAEAKDYQAVLSVCPYYNKPNQEGLYRHFTALADASPLPILLYNVPGRTGVNLLPKTVLRIYETAPDKILGIKEASGDEVQVAELAKLIREKGAKMAIISGDDGLCYQLMQLGAVGLISVASNAFPDDFARLVHERHAYIQAKYETMIDLLFREGNPVGIKAVLAQQGVIRNVVRLPLAESSAELNRDIEQELEGL